MFCQRCGGVNPDTAQFCNACGLSFVGGGAAPEPPAVPLAATGAPIPPTMAPQTSGLAIASLILGFFAFILPAAIVGVVCGHLSLSEIKRNAGRVKGSGMAIAGLIMGYLGIAIIPLLIIAAIAIPNLLRAKVAANEASAVGSVRQIVTAELKYEANNPNVGYTCELGRLGAGDNGARLIDSVLASGEKNGYIFALQGCSDSPPNAGFRVVAYPKVQRTTGMRAFCADQTGVIRSEAQGSILTCFEAPPLE